MPWPLLLRDLGLLAASLLVWRGADAWQGATGGWLPAVAACAAGILLALAFGYAAHEWGHFLAARAGGGTLRIRRALASPTVFEFPVHENNRSQFLWMAWGGLAGVWLQAGAFALLLPATAGGLAAILFSAAGALFTTLVEGPKLWRVLRDRPVA